MSKRPSPLTTARSRAYTQRLEQMLMESSIRLAAATEAIRNLTDSDASKLIDSHVDDWHYLNQERGEFPGVAVPEWVADRWAVNQLSMQDAVAARKACQR